MQQQKLIVVPDDILKDYLSAGEVKAFKQSGTGIYSIIVYAEKP